MRVSRKRRSAVMKGSEEDRGRWVRCWHCNFPFDTTKVTGGSGSGKTVIDVTSEILTPEEAAEVVINRDADGNPVTETRKIFKAGVAGGCPFCGTRNIP